jgi:DNA-binding winged helix-turn-helix (wHTH) protein
MLRFEGFTLDLTAPALNRGAERVPLRHQSLKVLVFLADRSGKLVSQKELIESCWEHPKQTNANSLAQCIKEIRGALADKDQSIIRTVSRRGGLGRRVVRRHACSEASCGAAASCCMAPARTRCKEPRRRVASRPVLEVAAAGRRGAGRHLGSGGLVALGRTRPTWRAHYDGRAVDCRAAVQGPRRSCGGRRR